MCLSSHLFGSACVCLLVSCSMALYLPVGFGYFGVVFVIIDFGAIF